MRELFSYQIDSEERQYLDADEKIIRFYEGLVLEMIARAGSGLTMMPLKDREKRLRGIGHCNTVLQGLRKEEIILQTRNVITNPYFQGYLKKPFPIIIARVAQRESRKRKYTVRNPSGKNQTSKVDLEEFI